MNSRLVVPASFERPFDGPLFNGSLDGFGLSASVTGWVSNGGAARLHPARALPFTLTIEGCDQVGVIRSISFLGVFSRYAAHSAEPAGTIGAHIHFLTPTGQIAHQVDLKNARHYSDAAQSDPVNLCPGDGVTLQTVGKWQDPDGEVWRLDCLDIRLPADLAFDHIKFRDMGTPASFILFAAAYHVEPIAACPFKGHGKSVALHEVGGILRLRDRNRFSEALTQLRTGISQCGPDLDEARGTALTFLAVVAAALLELGAPRSVHRSQLEAARAFEKATDAESIADLAENFANQLAAIVLPESDDPSAVLLDRALAMIDRHYARDISDTEIAEKIGLSTSHFRHLFRKHTDLPFHKFVMALRLEKARDMVVSSDLSMTEISQSVGFASPAHFSRVFHNRFSVSPSALRTAQKITTELGG